MRFIFNVQPISFFSTETSSKIEIFAFIFIKILITLLFLVIIITYKQDNLHQHIR
nr:MAG TPA: hypothetical protein [Ackermannviridae sp.]